MWRHAAARGGRLRPARTAVRRGTPAWRDGTGSQPPGPWPALHRRPGGPAVPLSDLGAKPAYMTGFAPRSRDEPRRDHAMGRVSGVVVAFAAAEQAAERVQPGGERTAAVAAGDDPFVQGAVGREGGAARPAAGDPLGQVGEPPRDPGARAVPQGE